MGELHLEAIHASVRVVHICSGVGLLLWIFEEFLTVLLNIYVAVGTLDITQLDLLMGLLVSTSETDILKTLDLYVRHRNNTTCSWLKLRAGWLTLSYRWVEHIFAQINQLSSTERRQPCRFSQLAPVAGLSLWSLSVVLLGRKDTVLRCLRAHRRLYRAKINNTNLIDIIVQIIDRIGSTVNPSCMLLASTISLALSPLPPYLLISITFLHGTKVFSTIQEVLCACKVHLLNTGVVGSWVHPLALEQSLGTLTLVAALK